MNVQAILLILYGLSLAYLMSFLLASALLPRLTEAVLRFAFRVQSLPEQRKTKSMRYLIVIGVIGPGILITLATLAWSGEYLPAVSLTTAATLFMLLIWLVFRRRLGSAYFRW